MLYLLEFLSQLFIVDLATFKLELFLRLFSLLWLYWLRRCFKLRLIKFSFLELSLTHETFSFDPLCIVIGTFAGIFKIHESFQRYKPCPFFIAISGTEVEHILESPYLETCRYHIFFFPDVTFVCFNLSQINKLC